MEGELIRVGMSVTNCTRDCRMRCTLIIRAEKRAGRKVNQTDTAHGWRIIAAPGDVRVMDYNTSKQDSENEFEKKKSTSSS